MQQKKQYSGNRHRNDDDPMVKLSKSLSYLLRHGAQKEGVPIRPDGYVKISDVKKWNKLKNVPFEKIQQVVEENNKKRFELSELEVDGQKEWYIRAVQGHTLQEIEDDLLLELVNDPKLYPVVVHGTYMKSWELIKGSGLKTMGRNHVHFAIGYPGEKDVISGMRTTCDIFIEVDMERAVNDGMKFYLSKNKVILSSGFEDLIPLKYFKRVVDKSGKIIYEPQQSNDSLQQQQQFVKQT